MSMAHLHKAPSSKQNAQAQAEGEHDATPTSVYAAPPPHVDEALWEALRRTILAPDMHGFDKKRTVAELIRQHLLTRGALYRTADGRLLFFSHEECRLYDLQE